MKTKEANLGLGDARSARRNARINHIDKRSWRFKRIAFFQRNIKFAAAAKAFRTAMDVTQQEVADYHNVSQGTVCNWESGKYSWPYDGELEEYTQAIQTIARS